MRVAEAKVTFLGLLLLQSLALKHLISINKNNPISGLSSGTLQHYRKTGLTWMIVFPFEKCVVSPEPVSFSPLS